LLESCERGEFGRAIDGRLKLFAQFGKRVRLVEKMEDRDGEV
jgi:hypothetical protein